MTFRVYCPSCRTPFDVDESLAGETGLCPSCQTSFRIELPAEPQTHALSAATAADPNPSGIPFLRGQIALAALGLAGYAGAVFALFRYLPRDKAFKAPEWVPVLGNFHPLILHLPIGLILGAVVLDFLSGKARRHSGAVTALLWISFLTAAPAAISGYLSGHDSDSETLRWHMWSGLAIPFLAGLTLFTKLLHESTHTMAT